jgi:hypothetical protein
MDAELEEAISYVFKDPILNENGQVTENVEKYSHIYLIRLQLKKCIDPRAHYDPSAITWPIAMTVLAGIDALGLYYTGGQEVEKGTGFYKTTGSGFKKFCGDFLGLDSDQQKALYQLRCAFLHTVSLISVEEKSGNKYKFSVYYQSDGGLEFMSITPDNDPQGRVITCKVNLYHVYSKFEEAVKKYRDDLKNETIGGDNFLKIYRQIRLMEDK